MATNTRSHIAKNTVKELLTVLKQTNPNSVVTNEKGKPVSAYLDVLTARVVIVEDDDGSTNDY